MTKVTIGVYCDKKIYSVILTEPSAIQIKRVEEHEGRLRHFRFIKYLKSIDFDLCIIVQNDESMPIINYLRREGKRPYIAIEFSPIPEQTNYRENPDLPTIMRKLAYQRKLDGIEFTSEQKELQAEIEQLGDGNEAIHMRTLNGFVLAFMAAAHGIFSLD